jgi:hypothetical protein
VAPQARLAQLARAEQLGLLARLVQQAPARLAQLGLALLVQPEQLVPLDLLAQPAHLG